MVRLVAASTPGLVERSQAIEFLATWDVLVRTVCRELKDRPKKHALGWRARAALDQLWRWKSTAPIEAGVPAIELPSDCADLYAQVRAGEQVCGRCLALQTADKWDELVEEFRQIDEALTSYWRDYQSPVIPPDLEPS